MNYYKVLACGSINDLFILFQLYYAIIPIEISKAAFMVVHFSRLIARVHTKNLDVVTTTPSLFCISRAQLSTPN